MTNWKETTLDEIATITMGQSPLSESYNLIGDGLPFYQGVTEFGDKYIGIKSYTNSPTKILDAGSILFSVRAPVGQVNITKNKCCIGRGNAGLVMKNGEQEFLYYLLTHLEKNILKNTTGTVFDSISGVELRKFPVLIPESKEEQKEIAGVLSSLDDKIELLQEENKTLEATAQAIFKEWFVNFNFPGATGKMIDSELGKIPEWWGVGKIKDLINIFSGFAFSSSDFIQNGKYRLVTIKNVQDRYFVQDIKDTFADLPLKRRQYCHLNTGDILLSLTGNVGRICLVVGENYLLNQRVAKLEAINGKDYAFTYLLFLQESIFSLLQNTASGTAQQNLSPVQTKEIEIVMPARFVLDTFGDIGNPMIKKVNQNNFQIQTLSTFRDTLLPKLMSGDLRIK